MHIPQSFQPYRRPQVDLSQMVSLSTDPSAPIHDETFKSERSSLFEVSFAAERDATGFVRSGATIMPVDAREEVVLQHGIAAAYARGAEPVAYHSVFRDYHRMYEVRFWRVLLWCFPLEPVVAFKAPERAPLPKEKVAPEEVEAALTALQDVRGPEVTLSEVRAMLEAASEQRYQQRVWSNR